MFRSRCVKTVLWTLATVGLTAGGFGCTSVPKKKAADPVPDLQLPKELNKVTHPTYTVESPDILLIESTRTIPLPPYLVQPLDALLLIGKDDDSTEPIKGIYPVDPDGTINLGETYGGKHQVSDLTAKDIEKKLTGELRKSFKSISVSVSLASSGRGVQQIAGQHLVRPDGTVGLGVYGSVFVAGMTLPQAKSAIEQHLTKYLYRPEVSVDVYSYNSKWYYVITDFAGNGEQVVRLPSTGNETVLDAISQIGGLSAVSSKRVWVARPAPAGVADQILPVDWKGITRRGNTCTNYQVLPGDRVFVMGQPITKFDNYFGRVLAPAERALGFTLLGTTTVQTIQGNGLFGGGNNGN
ncbi:polysaccharide biosynthesis/export family protein [Limnoglobus roseus]|uniref:Polysaccharide biosynthesis/export protein n=1 Tax=Limnoglobus roseus TaxID=2598579 RepID=A0A5C1AJX9_9BACT|nr:polysaccharide biosynthesis/export family protein [Limnoglobus roseus]QEL17218.1 polysaccharide biosynthesis/export protein [Limnoglobus roseus]